MKQTKRRIRLRVTGGLLALWLVFFGAFSVWQLLRQRETAMKECLSILDTASGNIADICLEYQDRKPGNVLLAVEPEWDVAALATQTLMGVKGQYGTEQCGMELACFDADGKLLAMTGPYLVLHYTVPPKAEGRVFGEEHYGILDVREALPEDAAEKLLAYASYWDIRIYQDAEDFRENAEAGHLEHYEIFFQGLWSDGRNLIPGKIVVCEHRTLTEPDSYYLSPQFDEAGNMVEAGNMPIVWVYENEPPAEKIRNMLYIQGAWTYSRFAGVGQEDTEAGARVLDSKWSQAVRESGISREKWETEGFLVAGPGYSRMRARGLLSTEFTAVCENYQSNTYLVMAGTYPTWKNSLGILGAAAAGSGVLLLIVGVLLCWQLGRVYEAQAELEAQRRRTTNAIAHDLKTPMAAITGYAENLLEHTRPDKQEHYLRAIHAQVGRMNEIVRSMLELSRLEAAVEDLKLTRFSLGQLCREAAQTQEEGWRIAVEGDAVLEADRELIRRVMDNFLSNARKHTPPGGLVTVTIAPGRCQVYNPGQPIAPEQMEKIWEPYYRADDARAGTGSGLGLSIVREILSRHGFGCGVENTPDGVVFWFQWDK